MFDTIQKIRVLLTPKDKYKLIFITLATFISAAWEVVGIGLLIPVVAAVVNPQLLEQNIYLKIYRNWLPVQDQQQFMIFTILLVVVNFAAKTLYNLWVLKLQSSWVFAKQCDFSCRLFSALLHTDYAFMLKTPPSELSTRVSRINFFCDGTLLSLLVFCSDLGVIIVLLAVLIFFMPQMIILALAAFLLIGGSIYLPLRRISGRLSCKFARLDNAVTADKWSAFAGIKAVKSSGCEDFMLRRFSGNVQRYCAVYDKFYRLGQVPRLLLEFLAVLLALGIFAAMIISGMPAGSIVLQFALLIAVMGRVMPALSRMHYNLARIRQSYAMFNELYDDLTNIKPEVPQDKTQINIPGKLQNNLEIKDLEFAYKNGKKVFDKFTLTIPAYSSVALTGPTGGGKTTLADLAAGLLKPDAGSISFDGVDIWDNIKNIRSIIGYVPQYVYLFEGSIRENVAFGIAPEDVDEEKLANALKMAHLSEWVESLPEKTYAPIGENGVNVSGGQRQRLGIARALYREPQLLILDEVTSALDSASENAVVEALETLHGKLTMIIIAHRLSTVERCDCNISIGNNTSDQ